MGFCRVFMVFAVFSFLAACMGCGGDEGSIEDIEKDDGGVVVDGADDDESLDWYEPDPEGRRTEGNLMNEDPEMIVITSAELAPAWEIYAGMRSLQGVHARVVDLVEALDGQPGVDDAEKLQSYLRDQVRNNSLRFVLLGGDADVVPFRRIPAEVTVPTQETYTTNGPSLLYFANVEVDWDSDGDGVFGQRGKDMSLADARESQLAPGRVPVNHPEEVFAYAAKVEDFLGDVYGRSIHPLLISDIAASVPIIGDIDAAEAIEVTFGEFFPDEYKSNVRKLYATSGAASSFGGEVFTTDLFSEALGDGYSIVFHQGHGSHGWLTDQVSRDFVKNMTNEQPSILLSCACLAGNFADVATTMTHDGWRVQGEGEDSSGELYVVGTRGGVAYVGNTGTGLGPVGGSQFLHALFEGVFLHSITAIGEAFNYARGRAREIDFSVSLMPDMMDDDTEWFTQIVVTLLGDPSIDVYTGKPEPLFLDAPLEYGPGYQEMSVDVTCGEGEPVHGVTVGLWKRGDFFVEAETDEYGRASFSFIPYGPDDLYAGVYGFGFASSMVIIPAASK